MLERSFEPSLSRVSESITWQQVAHEFREEVDHREAFDAYCQWYYETAAQHRAELAAMEKDISPFHWFGRRGS